MSAGSLDISTLSEIELLWLLGKMEKRQRVQAVKCKWNIWSPCKKNIYLYVYESKCHKYTEKKDLIESKTIICLNDFLWFKEMICLNETKFVWFGPNKYLFESNKFLP